MVGQGDFEKRSWVDIVVDLYRAESLLRGRQLGAVRSFFKLRDRWQTTLFKKESFNIQGREDSPSYNRNFERHGSRRDE